MKKIAILGSTGSIGTQTLEVVRANKDIEVTALAAGSNIDLLEKQIREFSPKIAAVWNEEKAKELKDRVRDLDIRVESGMDGLLAVATELGAEIVVTAVVGMIGIRPTIAAMNAGKDIALANKETLVTAGHIIMSLAKEKLSGNLIVHICDFRRGVLNVRSMRSHPTLAPRPQICFIYLPEFCSLPISALYLF